jgi:flagellar biosynthetic protein FliO
MDHMMRIKAVLAAWIIGTLFFLFTPPARGAAADVDAVPVPRKNVRAGSSRLAGPATGTAPPAAESADDPESRPLTHYRKPDTRVAGEEDSGGLFMSIAGKLALVVALILGCAAAWKRFQGGLPQVGQPASQAVKVTSTLPIGPQRFLHLVTVGGHQLLLGSTSQSISLIAALDETSSLVGVSGITPPQTAHWATSMTETGAGTHESMEMPDSSPADRFEELLARLHDLEAAPEDELRSPRSGAGTAKGVPAKRAGTREAGGGRPDNRWSGVVESQEPPAGRGGARSEHPRSGEAPRPTAWDRAAGEEEVSFAGPAAGVVAEALGPGSLFRSSGRGPRAGGNA